MMGIRDIIGRIKSFRISSPWDKDEESKKREAACAGVEIRMSDNDDFSSDESPQAWTPYSDREQWKDVKPVEQDDGPNPIVPIAYSEKFVETHNYFRAILNSKEKSERALNLTADCIWLNAANYTVWQYRREILKELGIDLKDELKFIEVVIKCNFKNYQVWHHRKVIVDWMQDPSAELPFTRNILEKDSKNYHAWQHRQWVIATFDLYENELEYVEQLIKEDIFNNSAWNQRYFVLNNTTKFEPEVIEREVEYTLGEIKKVPGNESAWNYLRGVLLNDKNGGLAFNEKVLETCRELYDKNIRVNHLLACIIDICADRYAMNEPANTLFHIDTAFELCTDLAENYDKIRKRYWEYMSQQIREKINSAAS